MTRRTSVLLLLAGILLGSGVSALAKGSATHLPATASDFHRLGYAVRWAIDLNTPRNQTLAYVEILDDVVVTLETPSNLLTAVSVGDGTLLWRHVVTSSAARLFAPFRTQARNTIGDTGRPIALNNLIMVNSENTVYMFNVADGQLIGERRLPRAVNNAPAVSDNYAIFGAANGEAFAVDLVNGFKKWAYKMPAGILARPVVIKPSVFVADAKGVYGLIVADPYSGEDPPGFIKWKGETFARVDSPPAVNNQGIYLASEDQSLYSFNRDSGKDRWIYRAGEPLHLGPVALGNSLYQPLESGSLLSLDPANGNVLWTFPHLAKPVLLVDQRLILSGGDTLWLVDNQSGKPTQEVNTLPLRAVLRTDHNGLLMVTPNGQLQRLDPES